MDGPVQQILSGLLKVVSDSSNLNATDLLSGILNATSTNSTTTTTGSFLEGSMPANILAFVPFLFSFSALRDWAKIFLLGGLFETCRRWFGYFWEKVIDSFYMSASFDEDDSSYQWMMVWLSKQPAWSKIRNVEVSTNSYGVDSTAIHLDDDDDEDAANTRKMSYIPSPSKVYTLWYKGRYLTVTRSQEQGRWGKDNKLHLTLLTRNSRLLGDLLREARKTYMTGQEDKMGIWTSDSTNNWRQVARREKRSLSSIVLEPGIKDLIVADAQDFLNSRKWYTERGIPFRRGYLLYGAPGSGKTSLIHSLAGELELDVYIISLSRIGLDDSGLDSLINELPERCVALMEDVDAAFTHGLNRELDEEKDNKRPGEADSDDEDGEGDRKSKKNGPVPTGTASRVSLSGLLNALDGIGAQEGRILFATTNKYSSLDPALCRPGRMDLHIEFKLASRYQARELFKRFYNPNDDAHDDEEDKKENADKKKKKEGTDVNEKDSGYNSSASASDSESVPLLPSEQSSSNTTLSSEKDTKSSPAPSQVITGLGFDTNAPQHTLHTTHVPKLSKRQLERMADDFANAVPERELSMASLQGYLMIYKIRPQDAVANIEEWAKAELRGKREKERKKEEKERRRKEREEKERKEKKEKEGSSEKAEEESKDS